MSKMRSSRKPPLAKSPIRFLPGRVLRSNSTSMQTPLGSLTKSQKPNRSIGIEAESGLRHECRSISCQLQALAKMVREEFGNGASENEGLGQDQQSCGANKRPLFVRGRFYDVYSARRNERLKRKKGETGTEAKTAYKLGVTVESGKRNSTKKMESLRKSVSAAYSVERSEATPRYLLRSMTKENKKPPLPVNTNRFGFDSERKIRAQRVGRI